LNNFREEQKDLSHSTFLDFTINKEYKDPIAKITKRLFVNNSSLLSDKRIFNWYDFDDTKKDQTLKGRFYRNNFANYVPKSIKYVFKITKIFYFTIFGFNY
jgi:hypothetical protein